MAHTPGPWRAKGGTIIVNGSNCYEVREIWNDQGGYNPDDIRLMAAAPELLRQLKWLLAEWEESNNWEPDYMPMCDDIRALIAETEGR